MSLHRSGDKCAFCPERKVGSIAGHPLGEKCLATIRAIAKDAGMRVRLDQPKRIPTKGLREKRERRRVHKERFNARQAKRIEALTAVCLCGNEFVRRTHAMGRAKLHCSTKCAAKAHRVRRAEKQRGAA